MTTAPYSTQVHPEPPYEPALLVGSVVGSGLNTAIQTRRSLDNLLPRELSGANNRAEHSNAAHRPIPSSTAGGNWGLAAVRSVGMFVEAMSHEGSLSCSAPRNGDRAAGVSEHQMNAQFLTAAQSNVHPIGSKEINSGKGNLMANIEHPIDAVVVDMAALKRDMEAEFIGNDGVICEREAGILLRFEEGRNRISRARAIERANTLAVKQEGVITDYTREAFRLAGLKVEPLDAA